MHLPSFSLGLWAEAGVMLFPTYAPAHEGGD